MSCPNTPACRHTSFLHTVDDLDDDDLDGHDDGADHGRPPPRCCMLGCMCGAVAGEGAGEGAGEALLALVPAPREPADVRGVNATGARPCDDVEPASSPAAVEVP